MDFWAAIRKAFGDQSADVIPSVNYKQLNNSLEPNAGLKVSNDSNPYIEESEKLWKPTALELANDTKITPIVPTVDPYAAMRAAQGKEAQGIKDRILGRGGEIDSILNDILGRVDSLVADRKTKRQGQYDTDSAALIDSLNAAIPEIQKAFASLGLSSSTFVDKRVGDTEGEYKKSQATVDQQFDDDVAGYGAWADAERANARASADKARNDLNFVRDAGATADNLSRFQESERSFNNALTDFGAQRGKYTTSGDALKSLENVGKDFDFSKVLDSFGALAASSANTGTGGGAAGVVADTIKGLGDKAKKKLSEVQVNNPVGAAAS